jgi:hypothetical protein
VDGPGGLHHQLVKCNFELDLSDSQFQVATTTSLFAEYPIAFECALGAYDTVGVIPCSTATVNVGNAMSTAGIFTVPFDGVYLFSFSASSDSDHIDTYVDLRVDGSLFGGFHFRDNYEVIAAGDDYLSGSSQVVQRLKKGQKVDAYLESGSLEYPVHFNGHLLFPE